MRDDGKDAMVWVTEKRLICTGYNNLLESKVVLVLVLVVVVLVVSVSSGSGGNASSRVDFTRQVKSQ